MLQKNKILIVLFLQILSCSINTDTTISEKEFNKKTINHETLLIRKQIIDSLDNFKKNNLSRFDFLKSNDYQLDSSICLNTSKTKLVTTILNTGDDGDELDYINLFLGSKIKEKWYFWRGDLLVIPRKDLGYSEEKPISFENLHKLAIKHVYGRYLQLNPKTKKYEINEQYFDRFYSGGWGRPNTNTKEGWDSLHIELTKRNWSIN